MDRRDFLRSSSAAAILAGGGGLWFTLNGSDLPGQREAAFAAWDDWNMNPQPSPWNLLRAAVLAASPHNTQPWRFRVTPTEIELYLETKRRVSGLDPYLREAHIGMGCALENIVLAAAANGYRAAVTLDDGTLESRHKDAPLQRVAHVNLAPGEVRRDSLYNAIPNRHTNRGLYDAARELPSGFTDSLLSLTSPFSDVRLFLFTEPAARERLTRISAAANAELYSDARVEAGSEAWIRWNREQVEQHRDGITFDNVGLSPWAASAIQLLPESILKPISASAQRSSRYAEQMKAARLTGVIAVRNRMSKAQSLEAGRLWQRAHLLATHSGVAAKPCNEAVEMIDYEQVNGQPARRLNELASALGDAAWQPTFLFIMGMPTQEGHRSPRRTAEAVALSSPQAL